MARSISVEIIGDASQFKKELESAVASTNKANSGFARMQKAAGIAGAALAGGLAVGLTMSVKAAMAAEESQGRLAQAFQNAHVALAPLADALSKTEGASRKLGFTDSDVRDALGSLITATHSYRDSVKDLGVAEDIARFKHVGLSDASKMLTMAMTGSQRAAKQLGITVIPLTTNVDKLKASQKDLTTAAGKLALAHAKLQDKMATGKAVIDTVSGAVRGQAAEFAKTAAGSMAQFHAQIESLKETLGKALLPALKAVAEKLADVAAYFSKHTTLAKALVVALGALAAVLLTVGAATKVYAAFQTIAAVATAAWTAAQWALNVALTANPIGIVVVAIAALVAGLILAWRQSSTFRAIVTGAFDAVKAAANALLDFFRSNWRIIVTLISGPFLPLVALATNAFGIRSALVGAAEKMFDFFRSNWKTIAVLISGPFAPLVALATNAFGVRSAMISAFDAIKASVGHVLDGIMDAFRWMASNAPKLWDTAAKGINKALDALDVPLNAFLSLINAIKNAIAWILDKAPDIPSIHLPSLPSIPNPFGKRQHGGPVRAGSPYIVGEKGPELFLPSVSGTIVAKAGGGGGARAMPGAGGITLNVNLSGTFLGDQRDRIAEQLADSIHDALLRKQRRNGSLGLA